LGLSKSGFLRQLTSLKRFILYEIFYDETRKRWPNSFLFWWGSCYSIVSSRISVLHTIEIYFCIFVFCLLIDICIVSHSYDNIKTRENTSLKRFILYEIFYDETRKRWPFNTGDCLIEVTTKAGLTAYLYENRWSYWWEYRFDCIQYYILITIRFSEAKNRWSYWWEYRFDCIQYYILRFDCIFICLILTLCNSKKVPHSEEHGVNITNSM
jgi:hypothetical protein